jgi:hypothetical protein
VPQKINPSTELSGSIFENDLRSKVPSSEMLACRPFCSHRNLRSRSRTKITSADMARLTHFVILKIFSFTANDLVCHLIGHLF